MSEVKNMKNPLKQVLLIVLLAVTVGVAGCATTQEVEQLRTDVKAAADRAASAEATANAAKQEAAAARAAAERAEQAAMDAKAAAEATDEKIDRMFKKTMNK
jgi:murein lipoprotein